MPGELPGLCHTAAPGELPGCATQLCLVSYPGYVTRLCQLSYLAVSHGCAAARDITVPCIFVSVCMCVVRNKE